MDTYRALTPGEIAALEASGSTADDWSSIEVAEDFHPSQLRGARLGGRVRLASGVRIRNSGVRNYDIGARTLVEEVVRLECRGERAIGNGTEVAVMNENGGRTVRIYSGLAAQLDGRPYLRIHRPHRSCIGHNLLYVIGANSLGDWFSARAADRRSKYLLRKRSGHLLQ